MNYRQIALGFAVASFTIAAARTEEAFDPGRETAQHCAAILSSRFDAPVCYMPLPRWRATEPLTVGTARVALQ